MKRLVAMVACVLGLGSVAPLVASATTNRDTVPFRTTILNCSGELVRVRGELLLISHFTEDSNGGFHDHFSLVPRHVKGISPSGVSYKVVGGDRSTFNVNGQGTETFTNTDQFMIISQSGEDNLLIRFTFHITVNGSEGRSTTVDNFSEKCVG